MGERRRVAVVTGGGGGIGAAIAEALGRAGTHVVTLDPMVSLDGSEQLAAPEETTADRINAAGGSAEATSLSVTDADGVRELFERLAKEHGGLDAVVNVAGITRPTSFSRGSEDDWRSVLEVHLGGYLNVLRAALPLMAVAGYGRVLGVTSGSGWRPADAGAYSCAKRAVAALTWQLGRACPPGVVVNAISPIAATRMVTAALARTRPSTAAAGSAGPTSVEPKAKGSATGGLSLASMPSADQLGPLGAHLVGDGFAWCSGQVVFTAGSEAAVIDRPRPLEVVRLDDVATASHVLTAVAPALVAAETSQATTGGSNARFAGVFDEGSAVDTPGDGPGSTPVRGCLVVADDRRLAEQLGAVLEAHGVMTILGQAGATTARSAATEVVASAATQLDSLDAIVVMSSDEAGEREWSNESSEWERVLDSHAELVARLHHDAGWSRAAADHAATSGRPLRMVTLTGATSSGGRSRAQSAAQLARAAGASTDARVAAHAVSVEAPWQRCVDVGGELVVHLLGADDPGELAGAELALGDGWLALRSHPRPVGSVSYGGPEVPAWFDDALREIVGVAAKEDHDRSA